MRMRLLASRGVFALQRMVSSSCQLSLLKIIGLHLALYASVVGYLALGGVAFMWIEGGAESAHSDDFISRLTQNWSATETANNADRQEEVLSYLRGFMLELKTKKISVDEFLRATEHGRWNSSIEGGGRRWTMTNSVLYAFTLLTTIGYGNIAPTTTQGQAFTMIYGVVGIPLFLIAIADLGRFFKTGVMSLIQFFCTKDLSKKPEEHRISREIAEVFLVSSIFIGFIAVGSAFLTLWEQDLSYFESVYFSYISLTTIGLGDIVPRRSEFMIITLIYITVGLWLTTAVVEQMADVFKLVHYAGRRVGNVKGITVWFGGQRMSVGLMIQTICRRVGMSDNIVERVNWEKTLNDALNGIQPAVIPIFPWHFADFLEKDPPLIDMSVDLDEWVCTFFANSARPTIPVNNGRVYHKRSVPQFSTARPEYRV